MKHFKYLAFRSWELELELEWRWGGGVMRGRLDFPLCPQSREGPEGPPDASTPGCFVTNDAQPPLTLSLFDMDIH